MLGHRFHRPGEAVIATGHSSAFLRPRLQAFAWRTFACWEVIADLDLARVGDFFAGETT